MKTNRFYCTTTKLFLTFALVLLVALFVSSCAPNPSPEDPTSSQKTALQEWAEKHGVSDSEIIAIFLKKSGVSYEKNKDIDQKYYYWFDDYSLKEKFNNILPRVELYSEDPDVPVRFTFVPATGAAAITKTGLNSVGDRMISILGAVPDSDYAACVRYDKSDNVIYASQVEIRKSSCNYSEGILQTILLHELGHANGLKDVKDEDYKDQTVMWYSTNGYNNRTETDFYYILDLLVLKQARSK